MNTLTSRICSKTSLAIGLYLMTMASLGFLAHAQLYAMQLVQPGRSASLKVSVLSRQN